jgi:hypothetical protein
MLRCARPISAVVLVPRVRARLSDTNHETPHLASEILLSSLQPEFINQDAKQMGVTISLSVLYRADKVMK